MVDCAWTGPSEPWGGGGGDVHPNQFENGAEFLSFYKGKGVTTPYSFSEMPQNCHAM